MLFRSTPATSPPATPTAPDCSSGDNDPTPASQPGIDLSALAEAVDKSDWPEWIVTLYEKFMNEALPPEHRMVWMQLLATWVEIERAQGFMHQVSKLY